MKTILVTTLLTVALLGSLPGCSDAKHSAATPGNEPEVAENGDDVAHTEIKLSDMFPYTYNDEAQVPREVLQWFIDSGILEQPCSEEARKALGELEQDYEVVAIFSSNIYCAILPQGYRLFYRPHWGTDSDGTVTYMIHDLSLVGSTLEDVVFRAAQEDFPALEQKIRSVLEQAE